MSRRLSLLCCLACIACSAYAESLQPTIPGTTWHYQMTQEFGKGIRLSDSSVKADADGKVRLPISKTVTGSEKIDGVEVHKFEMRRQGDLQTIQFLQVNEQGVFELARGDASGERIKLNPPQKILSFPPKVGEKWEYHGEGGGEKVEETYEFVARESIEVPAGKFDAYHLRVIGTQPFPSVVDRWYVPNLGEIKDITEVRRPDGSMLQRLTFELVQRPKIAESGAAKPSESAMPSPKIAASPETKPSDTQKKFSITLGKTPEGNVSTEFATDTAKIFARWQAHDLAKGAKLRSVWIAEDVGEVAPPNYKIDEASVTVPEPTSNGVFSLSRPNTGWPAGSYRLEIYSDDSLIETVKFTVGK